MKAVILAGGRGTRLHPLTRVINKHLLPVGRLPMIQYAIDRCRAAYVEELLIITGKESVGMFASLLGSGADLGVSIGYRIQEKPGGIADALLLADGFIRPGEKFVLLLGDNLFTDSLGDHVNVYKQQTAGARVLLKRVSDPRRYGVPVMKDGVITRIEEKPEQPKSPYCVTGIYFYDASVFDVARSIRPSSRGEIEITDVNNVYAHEGQLAYGELQGWWTDAGTFESLYEASRLLLNGEERES